MSVEDILTYPDERLKKLSEPVTNLDEALLAFIRDLEATRRAGPGAVGIAAPQVGLARRIVIVDVAKERGEGHAALPAPVRRCGTTLARTPDPIMRQSWHQFRQEYQGNRGNLFPRGSTHGGSFV